MTDSAAKLTDGQEAELAATADRLGIDVGYARRNGDRISIAVLEKMVRLEERFIRLEARVRAGDMKADRFCHAHVAAMGGLALAMWSFVFPALEMALSYLLCMLPGDVACWIPGSVQIVWPVRFIQFSAGILLMVALAGFFAPSIAERVVGWFVKGK